MRADLDAVRAAWDARADLRRAWPKDPRYVDASPDEAQAERNAILRRAVQALAEHAARRGRVAFVAPTP